MSSTMTDMYDTQQKYQDYLDTMKNAQQAFADALQSWGGAFDDFVGQPATSWSLEPVPPKERVEKTFGYAERLLAAQKKLAIAFVESATSEAS